MYTTTLLLLHMGRPETHDDVHKYFHMNEWIVCIALAHKAIDSISTLLPVSLVRLSTTTAPALNKATRHSHHMYSVVGTMYYMHVVLCLSETDLNFFISVRRSRAGRAFWIKIKLNFVQVKTCAEHVIWWNEAVTGRPARFHSWTFIYIFNCVVPETKSVKHDLLFLNGQLLILNFPFCLFSLQKRLSVDFNVPDTFWWVQNNAIPFPFDFGFDFQVKMWQIASTMIHGS